MVLTPARVRLNLRHLQHGENSVKYGIVIVCNSSVGSTFFCYRKEIKRLKLKE